MTVADASQSGISWRRVPGYVAAQLMVALTGVVIAHAIRGATLDALAARSQRSDTFAGIRPGDVPGFVAGQVAGAAAATLLFRWLLPMMPAGADAVVLPHAARRADRQGRSSLSVEE